MEWRHTNSPVRAKAKRAILARKVMATVVWDGHGVLSFGWEQIDHSSYSPDLAPSDFHLLRYLKEFLGGKHFDTADEVKEEVQDWLSSQAADVYDLGIQKLVERYDKCLNKYGNDKATNFTGASAELKHLYKLVIKDETIAILFSSEGIKWKFLPPRTPNSDGLWEAGVKSFKYHLRRVVGPAKLTLEEFMTVIVEIEGILNSQPLTHLPSDIDDFQVLTPGPFLIGKLINAIPEPDITDKEDNLLNEWQKTQKFVQTIWKRWQNSYLSHLKNRTKWCDSLLLVLLIILLGYLWGQNGNSFQPTQEESVVMQIRNCIYWNVSIRVEC
ncbi:integrase catalytic domain-containing protein [Trichonephila clavipes]|uniref:Integrase catalytic domain-containing protein n=1 Tax=Trichonephila clavipes TaxID=2585209 RepID=A0A8X6SKB9_TRICX|nr:integrase catalytic domain-containing protein [Trichonephila clavipes]